MKKKQSILLTAVTAAAVIMSGCQETTVVDNGGLQTLGNETVTSAVTEEIEPSDTAETTTSVSTEDTTTTPKTSQTAKKTTKARTSADTEESDTVAPDGDIGEGDSDSAVTTAVPAPAPALSTVTNAPATAAPVNYVAPSTTAATAAPVRTATAATTKAHVSGYQYGNVKYEIKHDLPYMKALNTDFIGWLTIKDTPIDLPVVQASDNKFYLEHDFYGAYDYSKVGTTFADCHVPVTASSRPDNLIIYGHNIRTGVGLAKITNYYPARYGSLNFYLTHPTITYESVYGGQSTYVVFAGMFVNTETKHGEVFNYYKFRTFSSQNVFYQYFAEVFDRSVFYNPDLDIKYGDKFITLSTCYYPMGANVDTRFVVFARELRPGETTISTTNAYTNRSPKYFDYYYSANGGSWGGRKWPASLIQGYAQWAAGAR